MKDNDKTNSTEQPTFPGIVFFDSSITTHLELGSDDDNLGIEASGDEEDFDLGIEASGDEEDFDLEIEASGDEEDFDLGVEASGDEEDFDFGVDASDEETTIMQDHDLDSPEIENDEMDRDTQLPPAKIDDLNEVQRPDVTSEIEVLKQPNSHSQPRAYGMEISIPVGPRERADSCGSTSSSGGSIVTTSSGLDEENSHVPESNESIKLELAPRQQRHLGMKKTRSTLSDCDKREMLPHEDMALALQPRPNDTKKWFYETVSALLQNNDKLTWILLRAARATSIERSLAPAALIVAECDWEAWIVKQQQALILAQNHVLYDFHTRYPNISRATRLEETDKVLHKLAEIAETKRMQFLEQANQHSYLQSLLGTPKYQTVLENGLKQFAAKIDVARSLSLTINNELLNAVVQKYDCTKSIYIQAKSLF